MALGPNQSGSTLQAPVSSALGYGNALGSQVDDEEKKRRKEKRQGGNSSVSPTSLLRGALGY